MNAGLNVTLNAIIPQFKLLNIANAKENTGMCPRCNRKNTPHIAVFNCPSHHSGCMDCLDELTDNYRSDSVNVLFECYACSEKITDIVYV